MIPAPPTGNERSLRRNLQPTLGSGTDLRFHLSFRSSSYGRAYDSNFSSIFFAVNQENRFCTLGWIERQIWNRGSCWNSACGVSRRRARN